MASRFVDQTGKPDLRTPSRTLPIRFTSTTTARFAMSARMPCADTPRIRVGEKMLDEFLNQRVVIDMRGEFVCLGVLLRFDEHFLELRNADRHDARKLRGRLAGDRNQTQSSPHSPGPRRNCRHRPPGRRSGIVSAAAIALDNNGPVCFNNPLDCELHQARISNVRQSLSITWTIIIGAARGARRVVVIAVTGD
jgi:hypothetical protein